MNNNENTYDFIMENKRDGETMENELPLEEFQEFIKTVKDKEKRKALLQYMLNVLK